MEIQPAPIFWQPGSGLPGNGLRFRSRTIVPYTRLEREYRVILNEILIKPRWWTKIKDPEIREKWEKEAREALTNLRSMPLAFDNTSAKYPLTAITTAILKVNYDIITQNSVSVASTQSGEDNEDVTSSPQVAASQSPAELTEQNDEENVGGSPEESESSDESDEDGDSDDPTTYSETEIIDSAVAFLLHELQEIANRGL
ncbi:hypothetical protein HDU93_004718, partial [Gonapodya sp. JEL0774]